MPPRTIRWHADPHTLAKHEIVKKYMSSWIPIMSHAGNRKIGIIDGFSGPGEYKQDDGSVLEGSPLIMLRALLDRADRDTLLAKTEFLYLFIDNDERRLEHLKQVAIPKLGERPDRVQVECSDWSFEDRVNFLFNAVEEKGNIAVPMFVLVDPFGFKGIPMDIIARILANPHSEVMVTFMLDSVNRFLEHPDDEIIKHLEALLGCQRDDWMEVIKAPSRFDALRDLYTDQLRKHARFVRTCRMISRQNRPIYELVFATNHRKGIDGFKDAMWKVDPIAGGSFSDITAGMDTLFGPDASVEPLRGLLLNEFSGRTVMLPEIERFVDDTPFRHAHIRRQTLDPLVEDGTVTYVPPKGSTRKRAKGTFPKGCAITFP